MADGVYNRRPWAEEDRTNYKPQSYLGPFGSNQERLMNQAMAVATMTSEEIQQYVRPNLPQVRLFPETVGFHTDEVGIADIVHLTGRPIMQRNESDFSQAPESAQSTSRNTLGNS